jgi:outer membrane lipoprotein-sorting protein
VEHNVHRCLLWLDAKTFLPVKTMTYNESGELLEEVVMDHLEVNIALPDTLFES